MVRKIKAFRWQLQAIFLLLTLLKNTVKKYLTIFCAIDNMANLNFGGVAQLVEHLICIQDVAGSIPVASTI